MIDAEKNRSSDPALGGGLNSLGRIGGALHHAEGPPQGHSRNPRCGGQLLGATVFGEIEGVSHVTKNVTHSVTLSTEKVKQQLLAHLACNRDSYLMSPTASKTWETPYRLAFIKVVEDFMSRENITRPEAAERFGMGANTLHQMLSNKNRHRPGDDLLKRVATVTGCDLSLLTPIPGAKIPGITADQLGELSTAKQLVMNMLWQNLKDDSVSDEQAIGVMNVLLGALNLGKIRPLVPPEK